MVEMLDAILLVSRAEAGKLEVQKAPVDVDAFCSDVVASLQDSARGSQRIEYTFAGDWSGARLDPKHLRHVLVNLLSNAMKYSPGASSVRLTLQTEGDEGLFTVEDFGMGIPDADLGRLFQSFQRGSNVTNIPGTGLGLAIAKHSVDACGGRLTVTSEVGKGTRFVVRLPLERATS
jgi:signal transduction histidine kinase